MSLSHSFSNVIALLVYVTLCNTKWDHHSLFNQCKYLEINGHDAWSLLSTCPKFYYDIPKKLNNEIKGNQYYFFKCLNKVRCGLEILVPNKWLYYDRDYLIYVDY